MVDSSSRIAADLWGSEESQATLREPEDFPAPPHAIAFHGVFGRLVAALEPHTEADPMGLLVNALVAFGAAAGRGVYFVADGSRHYGNEFAVMVGDSANARKGTATNHVLTVMRMADEPWTLGCVKSGLTSGEGIIYHVRDPRTHSGDPKKQDDGVTDKRLLALEPEFASVLRRMDQTGSSLSSTLRDAWDRGTLSTLNKSDPVKSTGAHISLVGHIVDDEVRRYLTTTETANGFGNRILWASVRRSKLLPEGGSPDPDEIGPVVSDIRDALAFVRRMGPKELRRTSEAAALWAEAYRGPLNETRTGIIGSMTARSAAHVVRLSLVYALADQSAEVHPVHLLAGMAVVDYANRSAAHIFGAAMGDRVQDDILEHLRERPDGASRTELRDWFGRNRSSGDIGRALKSLERDGLVTSRTLATTGRPAEVWTLEPYAVNAVSTLFGFIEARAGGDTAFTAYVSGPSMGRTMVEL